MPASQTSLGFPFSRVLLPRTRLVYIHLRNLLTDAKRDRAARVSGYVAVWLPEEFVLLYLSSGELVNATVRDAKGRRAIAIASALELVPSAPEDGEICFHEAGPEQLACMFATQSTPAEPWPAGMAPQDPNVLFPYLMSTVFDGVLEIIANNNVNYLTFRNGTVSRALLATSSHGTVVDRVGKLFAREGRSGDLRVERWGIPGPLPVQAPPALVQAYRELSVALVKRLVAHGRESAPAIAEHARHNLLAAHPALNCLSFSARAPKEPLVDTAVLTVSVAAWIREVIWAAVDHDSLAPEALLHDLTWERRHMFQSAGLYDQLPWKVV